MITPTIGRKVWYRPQPPTPDGQPHDATIVGIWSDTQVNLACFDDLGRPYTQQGVYLWPGEDEAPAPLPGTTYAEWMPYQQGQAKKPAVNEALGLILRDLATLISEVPGISEEIRGRSFDIYKLIEAAFPSGK